MDKTKPCALISVYDKRQIVDFARLLSGRGVQLLSTAGSADHLRRYGLDVIEVSSYTGFSEMMDGRVKTLHPFVHAGLLAPERDRETLLGHGIVFIDWLIVNFYPFTQTIERADCSWQQGIENIDVGGPAMMRAAAKNHERVTVVVDPDDYRELASILQSGGGKIPRVRRRALAAKAFAVVSAYDAAVSNWLADDEEEGHAPPAILHWSLSRRRRLRYGENPHQSAALYTADPSAQLDHFKQLQGKPLSYNNVADADLARRCAAEFQRPTCVIVKHAMPCAVASADDLVTACQNAFSADPDSAYGSVVAVNRPLCSALAKRLIAQRFTEVLLAPQLEPEAAEILRTKKNLRVVAGVQPTAVYHTRSVAGGFLLQTAYGNVAPDCRVVTQRQVESALMQSLLFAWRVVCFVRSNGIVLARGECTAGIGGGQTNRLTATRLAVEQARSKKGEGTLIMASDAFLPFRDSVDWAHQAGVQAIIQPGGSIRDDEAIQAADEHGMAMVFTGVRGFSHQ